MENKEEITGYLASTLIGGFLKHKVDPKKVLTTIVAYEGGEDEYRHNWRALVLLEEGKHLAASIDVDKQILPLTANDIIQQTQILQNGLAAAMKTGESALVI